MDCYSPLKEGEIKKILFFLESIRMPMIRLPGLLLTRSKRAYWFSEEEKIFC